MRIRQWVISGHGSEYQGKYRSYVVKRFNVLITDRAERQMEHYLDYLVNVKMNMQAAIAVSDDYDETIDKLSDTALWYSDGEKSSMKYFLS